MNFLHFFKRKAHRLWCPVMWEKTGRYFGRYTTRNEAVEVGFLHVEFCPYSHEVDYV